MNPEHAFYLLCFLAGVGALSVVLCAGRLFWFFAEKSVYHWRYQRRLKKSLRNLPARAVELNAPKAPPIKLEPRKAKSSLPPDFWPPDASFTGKPPREDRTATEF